MAKRVIEVGAYILMGAAMIMLVIAGYFGISLQVASARDAASQSSNTPSAQSSKPGSVAHRGQ